MKLFVCLTVSTLILSVCDKAFRKRPWILYLGVTVLGIIGTFTTVPFSAYITRGTLATSLFIIVMYARVMPVGSRLYKTFMALRAPAAIGASFLILWHNGKTLYGYIRAYMLSGAVLQPHEIAAAVCSAIMFVLLIPLTVTSFKPVRKKMKFAAWKRLQKTSYLFYFLMYAHVACLFGYQALHGKTAYLPELAIYTAVFGCYLALRLALWAKQKAHTVLSSGLRRYGVAATLLVSAALAVIGIVPVQQQAEAYTETKSAAVSGEGGSYTDGTYTGTAFGYSGDITVKVIVEDGKISTVTCTDYIDDDDYLMAALNGIRQQLTAGCDVTELDVISSATYSSKGIISALQDALENAE